MRNLLLLPIFTLFLACVALDGAPPTSQSAPHEAATAVSTHEGSDPKLILLSWDGAADYVVDRLLEEGRLPNLRRLARGGTVAEHSRVGFPSKTAPGHAALWTGCWASCNGVTANQILGEPPFDNLSAVYDGFNAEALSAEPLFVSAARAGKRVAVLAATHTHPADRYLAEVGDPERLFLFSGFRSEMEKSAIHGPDVLRDPDPSWPERSAYPEAREIELNIEGTSFYGLVYDDPEDPVDGLDTLLVRSGSRGVEADREAILKPRDAMESPSPSSRWWSPPMLVHGHERSGNTFFRLFELSPDGSRFMLYQRAVHDLDAAAPPGAKEAYTEAYPGFYDQIFWRYERGALGTTRMEGGDGVAESRLLELTAFDAELLIRGTRWVMENWRPDVLLHYSPMIDGAGHTWYGLFDPDSSAFDEKLRDQLWPVYVEIHRQLDRWLGEILDLAPPETIVAVTSDHGMAGSGRRFYPNRVMEEAGLLTRTDEGEIDLSRTRILTPPAGGFYLQVNDERWRGGIVSAAERPEVLKEAAEALLAARDPETGAQIVRRVLTSDDLLEADLGSAQDGDLFLDLAPDYYPSRYLPNQVANRNRNSWGGGVHGYWPYDRKMHAVVYLSGPGVPVGATAPPIRHIDVAPTLSRLLGIDPPQHSEGRVIEEFLEDSSPIAED